jgi:hypothetical protein
MGITEDVYGLVHQVVWNNVRVWVVIRTAREARYFSLGVARLGSQVRPVGVFTHETDMGVLGSQWGWWPYDAFGGWIQGSVVAVEGQDALVPALSGTAANGRGRAKTPRIFANNRAERNFSRFFRFQAV